MKFIARWFAGLFSLMCFATAILFLFTGSIEPGSKLAMAGISIAVGIVMWKRFERFRNEAIKARKLKEAQAHATRAALSS